MALEPGLQAYVEYARRVMGGMAGLKDLTVAQRRLRADRYGALVSEPYPESLEVGDTYIVLPGREIPLRIYRQRNALPLAPAILYLHGGSFMAGSPQGHDFITASLAANTGAHVISVHYRRAPENPYPLPTEDCYEALCWVRREAALLGIDAGRLVIAGDSAGGNLAAACTLMARDRAGPPIKLQALIYPTLDADLETPSYLHNTADAFLTRDAMAECLRAFLQGNLATREGHALPMRADNHANLPPAYLLLADHDPLLDDGVRYAEKLRVAGSQAHVEIGEGMTHGFLRARRYSAVAERHFQGLCEAIRTALGLPPPSCLW